MTQDLNPARLREVAETATEGPWEVYDRGIGYEVHAGDFELNRGDRGTFKQEDATHIAAFDPPTVMALIVRLEDAESERDSYRRLTAMRRTERREWTRRAEAAEQSVERVREFALTSDDKHLMMGIEEALDGEQNG